MNKQLPVLIAELRLLVGFLGEKSQFDWWGSNFLGASSAAFLMHPYPRTTLLAQYHGVCEAALLVHDEYIGVGKNYHLYRLPDSVERDIAKSIQDQDFIEKLSVSIKSKEAAMEALQAMAGSTQDKNEGPVAIGTFSDESLESAIPTVAAHYFQALDGNYKCFPYMREA
jgi:hypothetical protein